jgi:hypothetical protein
MSNLSHTKRRKERKGKRKRRRERTKSFQLLLSGHKADRALTCIFQMSHYLGKD